MARNIHITPQPVTLSGYQAVLKPSKFGYSLKAIVGSEIVEALETERTDCLKWVVFIIMILIGFTFFFVGMIAVTLGLELLNRIYVHLGVRKFVHWVKPHLRLPS